MIEGKVLDIYNDKELAINVGSEKGVRIGMTFSVIQKGREVFDPETKKSLGFIELIKGEIVVVNVSAKFSIANPSPRVVGQKFIETGPALGGILSGLSGYAGGYTKNITEESKLAPPEKAVKVGLSPTDKLIRVGDLIRMTSN